MKSSKQVTGKKRGPKGRNRGSFRPGDPRINRKGVPAEAIAFQKALRAALAEELQKPSNKNQGGSETKFQGIRRAINRFWVSC
jgi:hypothetical protein